MNAAKAKRMYYQHIVKEIIAKSQGNIEKIASIESIATIPYSAEMIAKTTEALEQQSELPEYSSSDKGEIHQYLDVFKFIDIEGKVYFALVYDSDALEQDPLLIKIIELKD